MAAPILPTAASLQTKAIDAIVALRPEALAFMNSGGRWARVPMMMRAQALLNLARLGGEVKSARLKFSTGDALRALAASEFFCQIPPTPQTASATLVLSRPNAYGGQGVIPKDFVFTKRASPNASPLAVSAATYKVRSSTYVSPTQTSVTLTLDASAPGAAGNLPSFVGFATGGIIAPSRPLFDPTLLPNTVGTSGLFANAGGGSSGLPDPVLAAAAKAYAVGLFGPNAAALVAGLYAQQSIRHYALFPATDAIPYAQVFLADESWGWSPAWSSSVSQALASAWVGFGDRVRVGGVLNQQVTIAPTIVLNSTDDLNDTSDIDANVRAVAQGYFDQRPDWYRFRVGTLQHLLGQADPRIQRCAAVQVLDALSGDPIPEPPATPIGATTASGTILHYYLASNALNATYLPPS